jgi:glycosyltransferase involved in cell wall biosynthesis
MERGMQTDVFYLDKNNSTTRLVTTQEPEIVNKPNDEFKTVLFLPQGEGRKGEGGLRTKGYFKQSLPEKSLITIVTVVFNSEQFLEETIQSVINQTYDNVEYIIIDGGSTDGTLEIIRKYENAIDYWVSEKDKGISDAFNKGIGLSQGDMIGIINADDWYESNTIQKNAIAFNEFKPDVICGKLQCWKDSEKGYIFSSNPSLLYKEMTINHPTVFVKKMIYKRFGLFKVNYKYAMDYELMLRFKMNGAKFLYLEHVLANMRLEGVSDKNWGKALAECKDTKLEYFSFLSVNGYYYFQILRGSVSRVLSISILKFVVTAFRKYLSIIEKKHS